MLPDMIHAEHTYSALILLVGVTVILAYLLKAGLRRLRVPGLVGYMLLGLGLRVLDQRWSLMSTEADAVFGFLAQVGVVALLFRIGLESNLQGLLRQLPRAGPILAGNIVLSALGGYAVGRWLGLGLVPSLFAAVSLTATSVGVCMAVWREKEKLNTANGELLVDVAELDDISGVGLMAVLFAVVPALAAGNGATVWPEVVRTGGLFLVKLSAFVLACVLFSRYVEERLTNLFRCLGQRETTMLLVAGAGFIIAAAAGWLGFSLAIGALLAGLLFSRDPEAVKIDTSFESLYELFTPFFFIGIGLNLSPAALPHGLGVGAALFLAAVVAKVVGAGLPALLTTSRGGALLIGLSMVPRAEIAMIVMQRGQSLGDWAVPPRLYAGMVVVAATTCTLAPVLLSRLLDRCATDG